MTTESEPGTQTTQNRPIKGVVLLLLAVAAIMGGVIYGVASWQQRSVAELKDAIASQQAAIQKFDTTLASQRAENSASLDKLRAENADLRSRLTAAEAAITQSQQRDPDAIYQAGVEVGRVSGASEDRAASTVTFESIEGGNFDRGKEFDWRDVVLMVKSYKGAMTSITGRGMQTQLTGVEATIVRTRAWPK